jgi:hypothetical protein
MDAIDIGRRKGRRKSKLIALLTSVGQQAACLETRAFSGEFAKVGKLCRRHSRSSPNGG